MRIRLRWAAFSLVFIFPYTALTEPPKSADPSATVREARPLADTITSSVGARCAKLKIQEAPLADDAEFLRRVYLDLYGRIPRVQEVRDFLKDTSADKREKLVDRLLESNGYVTNYSSFWRDLLIPPDNNQQRQGLQQQIMPWIQKQVRDNTPYDKMVYELLTASIALADGQNQRPRFRPPTQNGPAVFYQANEFKPENLGSVTSRLFLGVRLECANCHDHKFDKWKRKQFWQFAAFFAGLSQAQPDLGGVSPPQENTEQRELTIPGTDTKVGPRFLDDTTPDWKNGKSPREALADWITSKQNPYFARAIVNRIWGHLMGTGFVDPVDDFTVDNQPSNPELLDAMANSFVEHNYDIKFLIRAIVLSKPYQLTSRKTDDTQLDPMAFARMSVKSLTAEQFFDSLALATYYSENAPRSGRQGQNALSPRAEFLARFANSTDKRTEPQTSILQALALMNGTFINDITSVDRGQLLGAVIDYPADSTKDRVEMLYMSTLSRLPRSDELAKALKYIDNGGTGNDSRKAVADIFWALLNSSEFMLNH
jgi:hypothetical protein